MFYLKEALFALSSVGELTWSTRRFRGLPRGTKRTKERCRVAQVSTCGGGGGHLYLHLLSFLVVS